MKVLVLDDDNDFLETIKKILLSHNHLVDCAGSAKDALAMLDQSEYDYVFVDYKMPENDGIWFMKNAKLPRRTRALLMTAFVNREVINKMFALGACGYLIKPFNEEDLLRHMAFFER